MKLPILSFISLCLGTVLALPQSRSKCTSATISTRTEWYIFPYHSWLQILLLSLTGWTVVGGSLTKPQRLDYIQAVQCMLQTPPLLDQTQYPGVRNRMDDFTALVYIGTFGNDGTLILISWV
jgi:hypothetical protein